MVTVLSCYVRMSDEGWGQSGCLVKAKDVALALDSINS